MAHRRHPKVRDSPSPSRPTNRDDRNEMRDAVDVARSTVERRFQEFQRAQEIVRRRIVSLRRLETEDLRRHADEYRAQKGTYRSEDGRTAPVAYSDQRDGFLQRSGLPVQVRDEFTRPVTTLVCIRRRARRSVLFALRKIGKGSGKKRPARWSERSYIVCRRVKK